MLNPSYTNCQMTRKFNGIEYKFDGEFDSLEKAKDAQEDHKEYGSKTRRIKTQFDTYRVYYIAPPVHTKPIQINKRKGWQTLGIPKELL